MSTPIDGPRTRSDCNNSKNEPATANGVRRWPGLAATAGRTRPGAYRPASAGAVLHPIVDDDGTAGGVVGDIGGHPLALRRRPRRGHGGGVSEVGFEDREIRRFSRDRRHVEAVAPRERA